MTQDPESEHEMKELSPYSAMNNNRALKNDPLGNSPEDKETTADGPGCCDLLAPIPVISQQTLIKIKNGLRQVEVRLLNAYGLKKLSGAKYAFVNIIALAANKEDLNQKIRRELAGLGLELNKLEDAELISEREKKFSIDQNLKRLIHNISECTQVQFGTFHAYKD
jgi:hypothetical protein